MANPAWEKAREKNTVKGFLDYAEYCKHTNNSIGIAFAYSYAGAIPYKHNKHREALPLLQRADSEFSGCQLEDDGDRAEWAWVNVALGKCYASDEIKDYHTAIGHLQRGAGLSRKPNEQAWANKEIEYCRYMLK